MQVSASIKDTVVSGIEGLNINLEAPFKVQDYIVGFKYALGNLNKVPESVFARKSFDTVADGKLNVNADYFIAGNTARISSSWFSDAFGLTVGATGNSKDMVTEVSAQKDTIVAGNRFSVSAAYDLIKKVGAGSASVDIDNTLVKVTASSDTLDPVLSVTRSLDSQNDITPAISLKTGKLSYAWKRNWLGGSLLAKLHPSAADKRLELEWKDEGASGVWTTNAEFPLDDSSKCKISVSRDWKQ